MNSTKPTPGPLDAQDIAILTELRAIYDHVDPAPLTLTERTKYAMTVHMLEAEVAELTAMPMALVRSDVAERVGTINFSGSSMSLMVSVSTEATGVRVDCWVTVPGALVEIHPTGNGVEDERSAVTDEQGRCDFSDLPAGPAHFIVWADAERTSRPIITPTVTL